MRKLNLILLTVFSFLFISLSTFAQKNVIDLSGRWQVKLDADSTGIDKEYYNDSFSQPISLPGTLDEAKFGAKTTKTEYGILSRKHKYIGPAWYNKEIVIPSSFKNKSVTLYLERVMWQSKVWVDGKFISTQDGLGTPHFHNLGKLKPGKHLISIRVNNDMIYNIGDKGHSYGEYTQIRWNGILGNIKLLAKGSLSLSNVKVWTNEKNQSFDVTFKTNSMLSRAKKVAFKFSLIDKSTGEIVKTHKHNINIPINISEYKYTFNLSSAPKLWEEFNPNLYTLLIEPSSRLFRETYSETFGFRTLSHSKSKILVNNHPVFMRGNLDCLHFPLTGYPSCNKDEWMRIFRIYKDHGLNQVRFHSWCPPKAAFEAADELGIYIQAEVLWIDWWMSIINKDRPEMTTQGLPKGLGHNPSADSFVPSEMRRMVDAYGNHPSFAMMAIGNELGNSDFDVMESWTKSLKEYDDRRLYAVSTARKIMSVDQYMATHYIPNVGGTYGLKGIGTKFDHEHNYSQANIPIIAHELGQFPVYPLWSEIDKYTGVLEARNLIQLKESAIKNGLTNMDYKFHMASGALQTLLYKANIESLLRTKSCAGFQMLSMTDYSGQGEALVGWLDSFWDSKGIVNPEVFRGYSNAVVPLARFDKYVWNSNEIFVADLDITNYTPKDKSVNLSWNLMTSTGRIIDSGKLSSILKSGQLNRVGQIESDLSSLSNAEKCVLSVSIDNEEYSNRWNIWVYPPLNQFSSRIMIKDKLDKEAIERLNNGGKVLLLASQLGDEESSRPIYFTPLFWSNSFFPGQNNTTLGLYVDKAHPALANFVTDNYSDWQWQPISKGRSFVLNKYKSLSPIAQPISDFHINDVLASIFECKIGDGKLLVCGYDLSVNNVVAKYLKRSLLKYMDQSNFNPVHKISLDDAKRMFKYIPKVTKNVPKGFEDAILYVEAGKNLSENGSHTWNQKSDKIITAQKVSYKVTCDNVWKDKNGTAWTGKEISISLDTPEGIIGDLYVKFEDWNKANRTGVVSLEGREALLGNHVGKGVWIKLFMMREDTNDGSVKFKAKVKNGGNLMISKIALIKQK